MKFIHSSDWHIGRQLHNQSLLDDQRHVLMQLVALADEHKVDAVIVAGDIYDRSVPPASAVALLDEVLQILVRDKKIVVVMIAGNHDSHERLGFASKQLEASGLYIIGPLSAELNPITITGREGGAVVYGIPYADPALVRQVYESEVSSHEDAMRCILDPIRKHDSQGRPKIVVAHCFLAGGSESDSERPLSLGGADNISPQVFSGFNYVALGHLHGPQYKLETNIRYSGSILKYSFSEQHQKKSLTLVTLNGRGEAEIELIPLRPLHDLRIIEGELESLLEQGKTDLQREDYLMIRLLDKHAILDAMAKLRRVYPNVLHLERTGLMANNNILEVNRDHFQKTEMAMFKDFYQQVSGEAVTDKQLVVLDSMMNDLRRSNVDDEGGK
ncbi:MAG: exonuclease SbcD [Flavobacteriales bacterium]|jgi:exonuclease SbcD